MHDKLYELLKSRDSAGARELLSQMVPEEIARALQVLAPEDRQTTLHLLDQETALAVFELLAAEATLRPDATVPPPGLGPEALRLLLSERQFDTLRHLLEGMHPVDMARILDSLPPEEEVVAFRLLTKEKAVETFEEMGSDQELRLLQGFTDERAREIVAAMSPDERVRLLDELPAVVAHRLTQLLPPRQRQATLLLMGYPDDSAGRIMTPDFVNLPADMTVSRALDLIRRQALDKETIYRVYVTDGRRHLLGTVSLRSLMTADPDIPVSEVMFQDPKVVSTHADQEEVAQVLRDYHLFAVPVVDGENRLVGIVTWDDVLDIMEEEATEDIYRYGAVPVAERAYFSASIFSRMRRRLVWLIFLILVNTIAGTIIAGQSDFLTEVVILAAFIPLLMGTGGNIGAQSSTVVIRGLATGEISAASAAGTVVRECGVGRLLGLILGVITFIWGMILASGNTEVALAVSISLVAIAIMAAVVGGGLPFLFRVLKIDPAIASAPLVTTVMDVCGLFLFFLIASALVKV